MRPLANDPLNRLIVLDATHCAVRLDYTTDLLFSLEGAGVSPRVSLFTPGESTPKVQSVELPPEWIPTGSVHEIPGEMAMVVLW